MEPHIYRVGKGWLVFTLSVAAAMVALELVCMLSLVFPDPHIRMRAPVWTGYLFCVMANLLCLMVAARLVTNRVVLYGDAIEVGSVFGNRRMARSEIAAKMVMMSGCLTYVLYPASKAGKKLTVGVIFQMDPAFRDWMARIPDADQGFLRDRRHRASKLPNSPVE